MAVEPSSVTKRESSAQAPAPFSEAEAKIAHLAAIVEASDDAIVSKTLDGRIQSWNTGAQRLFGWTAAEAVGQSILLIIPPDRRHEEDHILATLRRGERIEHFDTTRLAKDGRLVDVSVTVSPIRNAAGTVIGASKIARDVTARRQRERAFLEREEQLRLATEAAEIGWWDVDVVNDTLAWPPRVKAMFGISPNVPVSMADFYAGLHPEDRDRTSAAFAAALDPQRRTLYDVEYRTVGKEDGVIRWVAAKGRGLFDEQGLCVRVIGTAIDISARKNIERALREEVEQRKRAEAALRASEQQLQTEARVLGRLNAWSLQFWQSHNLKEGIERMLEAVIELLEADKGHVQLLGEDGVLRIEAQRGFDQEFLDFFHEVSTADESACARALRTGEQVLIEDVEADGGYAPLRPIARSAGYRAVISTPLLAGNGSAQGMLSAHFRSPHRPSLQQLRHLALYVRQASDFLRRRQIEESLRHSQDALRQADRRKDEFLAMLAHELRNPLAPIGNATEFLAQTLADERAQIALGMIRRQIVHLTRLVDDLLDVARLTEGRILLRRRPIELATIIQQAVETLEPQMREKQHRLAITASSSHEAPYVNGDLARLVQCVVNLLGNAIKYTDMKGDIRIHTRAERAEVIIEVSDNGAGLAPDLLPRVFDLFVQSERTLDRAQGGLGIGLAVVKRLVELHQGKVAVRSAGVAQGSTFEIRLPRVASPQGQRPSGSPHKAPPRRILIVDDNQDAAESLAMLLALGGHELQVAYNGNEALRLVDTFVPEVALLDIGLPGMDGYELARRVRAACSGVRVVALSGYGQPEDRQRSREAGFDDHLVKPVDMSALETALSGRSADQGSDREAGIPAS